jgi:hypothetical protein
MRWPESKTRLKPRLNEERVIEKFLYLLVGTRSHQTADLRSGRGRKHGMGQLCLPLVRPKLGGFDMKTSLTLNWEKWQATLKENEMLRAENSSLKEELAKLKKVAEIVTWAESAGPRPEPKLGDWVIRTNINNTNGHPSEWQITRFFDYVHACGTLEKWCELEVRAPGSTWSTSSPVKHLKVVQKVRSLQKIEFEEGDRGLLVHAFNLARNAIRELELFLQNSLRNFKSQTLEAGPERSDMIAALEEDVAKQKRRIAKLDEWSDKYSDSPEELQGGS